MALTLQPVVSDPCAVGDRHGNATAGPTHDPQADAGARPPPTHPRIRDNTDEPTRRDRPSVLSTTGTSP